MKRREFVKVATASLVASAIAQRASVMARNGGWLGVNEVQASDQPVTGRRRQQIAMLVYPQFAALDLVGPHTFLSDLMDVDVHLVWKSKRPIATTGDNLSIVPSSTLAECPRDLDLLFVPGGVDGTIAIMQDDEILSFLADRGKRARYVTSVCTGSLILGSAGLLKGYRATSHWAFKDMLPLLGAIPTEGRVVTDRNRITGGGVTAGIDFGLTVAAQMRGVEYAEMLQLLNEYNPHPPFDAGTPAKAGPQITNQLMDLLAPGIASARSVAGNAGKKLSAT